MSVVVIVGILSVLAVVGYRKMVSQSHAAEALATLGAIKMAQESYHADTGSYLDVSSALCLNATCASLYPQAATTYTSGGGATFSGYKVGNWKLGWGGSCTSGCNTGTNWTMLNVHVDGGVMYGYSSRAGLAGSNPGTTLGTVSLNGNTISFPNPAPRDWFAATAVGDVDADGNYSVYLSSSFMNEIISQNDGE